MAVRIIWLFLLCSVVNGQDCGISPLRTKVVGGQNASAGAWPWQVSIFLKNSGGPICGGTLISDEWVLTAAHCILRTSLPDWTIYLGRDSQDGPNVNEVMRDVSKIIVHPDYNNTFLNNDIALMRLSNAVSFTNYIKPICLASSSSRVFSATLCWVTGWGKLNDSVDLPSSYPLQEVQVPVVGNNECRCNYVQETAANITDNMICAGRENKGSCQGDSGGPLQCQQGQVWIQVGIVSFGVPCAKAGFPEVYTLMSEFQKWITDQVSDVGFVTFNSSGTDPDSSFVCRESSAASSDPKLLLMFTVISVTAFLQLILAQ